MRSRYRDIVAIVVIAAAMLCPWTTYGQTASQTPSSADTLGVACSPNGALSYNGNSFVLCTSGVWAIDPVTIGTASVAPATCNAAAEGMLYFDTGGSVVKVCNGSTWGAVGAGSVSAAGSTGDVQFNNSGVLAANANFFWDNTNTRLGIGSASPGAALDILSNANAGGGAESGQLVLEGSANQVGINIINDQTGGHSWGVWSSGGSGSPASGFGVWDYTANSSRLYIGNSGNVGIGTTAPISLSGFTGITEFYNSTNATFVANGNGNATEFGSSSTGGWVVADGSLPLRLGGGGGTTMYMVSGGNVGIGSTSPGFPLTVNGRIASGSGGSGGIWVDGGTSQFFGSENTSIMGLYNGAWNLVLASSGNVGVGTAVPETSLEVHVGSGMDVGFNGTSSYSHIFGYNDAWTGYQQLEIDGAPLILNLNSSGSVGIGMSPTWTLDVSNTTYGARVNTWSDLGATTCGLGYVGDNLYMSQSDNTWRWTNTHGSLGGAAIQFIQCAGSADDILFLSKTGASTANAAASPTTNMIIKASGYVGIGSSSPIDTLDLNGLSMDGSGNQSGAVNRISGNGAGSWMTLNSPGGLYLNNLTTATVNISGDGGTTVIGGPTEANYITQTQGNYIYPGRTDSGNYQTSWYLASNGTYGLYTNTNIYAAGNLISNGCMAAANGAGYTCAGYTFYDNGTAYFGNTLTGQTLQVGNVEQLYGNYIWPGRNDGSGVNYQTSWYLASNSTYGLWTNTSMYFSGGIYMAQGAYVYPGCDSSCGNGQGSYFLYVNNSNSAVQTNGNFVVSGNIYCGSCSVWLTSWLNQSVTTGASPTFNDMYDSACGCWASTGLEDGINAWSTIQSDVRLKNVAGALRDESGLDSVMRLKPVRFHWKDITRDKKEGEQIGFIAQDVEKVYPQFVETLDAPMIITKADGSKETVEHPKILKYQNLTAPLVKAVQELKSGDDTRDQTLAALRARLDEDEREIAELKRQMRAP